MHLMITLRLMWQGPWLSCWDCRSSKFANHTSLRCQPRRLPKAVAHTRLIAAASSVHIEIDALVKQGGLASYVFC